MKLYEVLENGSKEQWHDTKAELGMDFPNLPYWIDDQVKISESMAIHMYLAERYKPELMGTDIV